MTFPRLAALRQAWERVPPLAVTVQRIAIWAAAVPAPAAKVRAKRPEQALEQLTAAGLPVMHGRPNDPMLDLIGL
jgi:hypothetical protein